MSVTGRMSYAGRSVTGTNDESRGLSPPQSVTSLSSLLSEYDPTTAQSEGYSRAKFLIRSGANRRTTSSPALEDASVQKAVYGRSISEVVPEDSTPTVSPSSSAKFAISPSSSSSQLDGSRARTAKISRIEITKDEPILEEPPEVVKENRWNQTVVADVHNGVTEKWTDEKPKEVERPTSLGALLRKTSAARSNGASPQPSGNLLKETIVREEVANQPEIRKPQVPIPTVENVIIKDAKPERSPITSPVTKPARFLQKTSAENESSRTNEKAAVLSSPRSQSRPVTAQRETRNGGSRAPGRLSEERKEAVKNTQRESDVRTPSAEAFYVRMSSQESNLSPFEEDTPRESAETQLYGAPNELSGESRVERMTNKMTDSMAVGSLPEDVRDELEDLMKALARLQSDVSSTTVRNTARQPANLTLSEKHRAARGALSGSKVSLSSMPTRSTTLPPAPSRQDDAFTAFFNNLTAEKVPKTQLDAVRRRNKELEVENQRLLAETARYRDKHLKQLHHFLTKLQVLRARILGEDVDEALFQSALNLPAKASSITLEPRRTSTVGPVRPTSPTSRTSQSSSIAPKPDVASKPAVDGSAAESVLANLVAEMRQDRENLATALQAFQSQAGNGKTELADFIKDLQLKMEDDKRIQRTTLLSLEEILKKIISLERTQAVLAENVWRH